MNWVPISITIDKDAASPRYQQIADAIKTLIQSQKLNPGDKLPPARTLARQLGVNTVTTVHAYRTLAQQNLVHSRVGSGTFVCTQYERGNPESVSGALSPFPLEVLRTVINAILDREGVAAFSYDDADGYSPLHGSLRRHLEGNGLSPYGHETVVFSGAQQGLSIIIKALVRPGDWVLVERPTYPRVLRLLGQSDARIEAVDVYDDGPDTSVLERLFRTRPFRLAYVMPTYQNPTGVCYSEAKKAALLELCRTHSVTLIEDDAFSDLDYGSGRRFPVRAQCSDSDDVLYLKSFSRLLLPGFRLGVCLCAPATAAVLRRAKEDADLFSSGFFQRVLHAFLSEGHVDTHLQRLQVAARQQLERSVTALAAVLGPTGVTHVVPRGGVRVWCRLPATADVRRFHAFCLHAALPAQAGTHYAVDDRLERWFSLCFGDISFAAWTSALEQIAAFLAG